MNKSWTCLLKKRSWIFLLFVSACMNLQVPVPTSTPTTLPATAAVMQTATEIPSIAPTKHLTVGVTPFPPSADYIIYGKVSTEDKRTIWMWAINPVKPMTILISKSVDPSGWSPSNKLWLLTGNQSIYISDANGSNVRMIYNSEEYQFFTPFWLTDDVVLFNAFKDYFLPPDLYSLN